MRRLAIVLPLLFTGCGGNATPSVEDVRSCLEEKRVIVTGKPAQNAPATAQNASGDDDAPDRGELLAPGAFIAFYSSPELADKRAAGIRTNAKRIKATVERKGDVTIVYLDTRSKDEIESCLGS